MSLAGLALLVIGFLLARAAIRSVILAAQLGKLSEERGEECPNGDCFPAPVLDSIDLLHFERTKL